MISRIRNLVWKEFIQLRRDWVMTAFILTLPVLQLTLLATTTASSIGDLSVAVLDRDRTSVSRRLMTSLGNKDELEIRHVSTTLDQARDLVEHGDAILAVVIPEGFAAALERRSEPAVIQLVADGSNELVADIALGAARDAIAELGEEGAGTRPQAAVSPVELRTTVRYNPTFDVKFFTVPAQVGFIIYQVTLTIASIGLARERELGTLEQLLVMPLSRLELVIGKAIPALVVGMLNFALMLGVAVFGFGIPMRGSLWLLTGLTFLFVTVQIGYGIFISGIAHTQQQAILLVFVLAMVDMAFSGYLVPIKNLPTALQTIAQVVPLRHYLTVLRSVMLKGADLGAVWQHAAAMVEIGLVITALAVRNLSRSLD
jgi:ABC-2 type transport system permease protein